MRKRSSLIVSTILTSTLLLTFVTTLVTSQESELDGVALDWYYNNLTSEDRKKIRQAMDYCIPRQQIIDEVINGLAVPLATEIPQNMMGYEPSISPRKYNIAKAKELMAEVFGKIFDNSTGTETNETVTITPYFRMNIIAQTPNTARSQWATMIAKAFNEIGIDTRLRWLNEDIFRHRIFDDPAGVGYDYDHGGFDAYLAGYSTSLDPNYSSRYFPNQFAPNGSNTQWIKNEEVVEIINRSLISLDLDEQLLALKEFQMWFHEWVPKSIILQVYDLYAVDPYLNGLDNYLISNFENCTIVHPVNGSQNTLTYTIPGDFVAFNPMLSDSYYDSIVSRNIFRSLASRRGSYNLTHPVGVLAEKWAISENGLVWDVKLREGVQWHDGTELTADDVVFTYQACFEEELGSPHLSFMQDRFGKNGASNIEKLDKYNVRFTLESFYPYVTTTLFGMSILQKLQMEQIDFAAWKTHGTNTGTEKLIGCGPYTFTNYDSWSTVTLVKSDNYNQDKMGHDPDAIGGGIWQPNASIETVYITVVKEAATCLTGLESGLYDIIDPQTKLQAQYDELIEADWANILISLDNGWEELVYNHYDPRWGMNPSTPWDLYPGLYQKPPEYLFIVYSFLLLSLVAFSILIFTVGVTIRQTSIFNRK